MTTNLRHRIARMEAAGHATCPISDDIIPVKQMAPEERARLRALLEQHVTDVEDLGAEPAEDDGDQHNQEPLADE